jgi:hypothetical protein
MIHVTLLKDGHWIASIGNTGILFVGLEESLSREQLTYQPW